jgi:chorismate-pyruvate lyase
MRSCRIPLGGLLALSLLSAAAPAAAWPDTALGRVEALAALQSLNVELLTHDSATATLEAWCAAHRLAPGAQVLARRVKTDKPAGPEVRAALQVGPDEAVRYRRVQLACGDRVLSEADNWYVPARLTPEMNRVLDGTDTPFGRAVAALNFRRRTTSAELLFKPLPEGWDVAPGLPAGKGGALAIPPFVLEHRATLFDAAGVPFSAVVESYTDQVLGYDPPGD